MEKTLRQIYGEIESLSNPSDVELLVVDNASEDATWNFLSNLDLPNIRIARNSTNQGMLGNLNICALRSNGKFVWCIGDDDYLISGALVKVLEILKQTSNALIYLNYAHAFIDASEDRKIEFVPLIPRLSQTGEYDLFEVIQTNSNLMTAIYALILRRDLAIECYCVTSFHDPFSSLNACVPTTVFALTLSPDTKVEWIAEPVVAVDLRVSWIKYAPLWILERFPEMILEFVAWGEGQVDLGYILEEMKPGIKHWSDPSLSSEYVRATNYNFLKGLMNIYGDIPTVEIQ